MLNFQFAAIPNTVARDRNLSIESKGLLTVLASHANAGDWTCYPGIALLCDETGLCRSTLGKYLDELIEARYVSRSPRRINGQFAGWEYSIHFQSDKAGGHSLPGDNSSAAVFFPVQEESLSQETHTQHATPPCSDQTPVCVFLDEQETAPLAMEEVQTHIDSHVVDTQVVDTTEITLADSVASIDQATDTPKSSKSGRRTHDVAVDTAIPTDTVEEINTTDAIINTETIYLVKRPAPKNAAQAVLDDELCKAVSFYCGLAAKNGRIENPAAYKATLTRKALQGELDLTLFYKEKTPPVQRPLPYNAQEPKPLAAWKADSEADPPRPDELRELRKSLGY
jgi:hypothetical protein